MSKAAAGIAILASVATVFGVFLAYMGNKQDEEFGRGAIYAKETEIAILKEQRAIMETIASISVNATQVIGTPEIVAEATSDLSATATVLSEEADKAATRVAEEETRVAFRPKLTFKQMGERCLSADPYCRLEVEVAWRNISLADGRVYLVGHSPEFGEMWWIAGNGIQPLSTNGGGFIDDGEYGYPGETIDVYVCQTNVNYLYESDRQTHEYPNPPECVVKSEIGKVISRK